MTFTRDLRRIQTAVARKYFETDTTGLTIERLLVLEYLARAGSVHQVEIGRECSIDKSSMGPLLKGLRVRGLVSVNYDEDNRRAKLVTITLAGEKVVATASANLIAAENAMMRLIDVGATPLRRNLRSLSNVIGAQELANG